MVLDASAVLEVLLRHPVASELTALVLAAESDPQAPHLMDVEVLQVLRRFHRQGEIDAARVDQALDDLTALPIERHPHELLLPRAWKLRHNLSAYDAVYVALAELLDAPLWTCDERLRRAVGKLVDVRLL